MARRAVSALDELLGRRPSALESLLDDEDEAPTSPPSESPPLPDQRRSASAARPLPPISIGTVADGGQPYSLRLADQPNQFIAITGSSGTGKTTLLRRVAAGVRAARIPVLVLDFHGDLTIPGVASQRIDGGLGLEPLAAGAGESETLELLRHAAPQLGHLQIELLRRELQALLRSAMRPRLAQLLHRLEALRDRGTSAERQQATGAIAALRAVFDAPAFAAPRSLQPGDLAQGGRLLLSGMGPGAQRLAASLCLSQAFAALRQAGPTKKTGALRLFVVLDEAALLQGAPELQLIVRESRKFGLGLAVASQQIEDHSDIVLNNAATLAVFRPMSRSQATEIHKRTGLAKEPIERLKPRGQCLIRTAEASTTVDITPPKQKARDV